MEAVERGCPAIRCEASAPGKLILMGEHSAVYGRPAVIAAVGMFTRAVVSPAEEGELEIDLPDLKYRERCTWEHVTTYGDRRRELWRDQGQIADTAELGSRHEAGVAKVAVAEAIRSLEQSRKQRLRPTIRLSVSSELPVGSGFGSSASVAVAVGAAFLGSLSAAMLLPDDRRIAAVSFETEKRQHGRPSGVDHTAVIRGGLLAVTRKDDLLRVSDMARPDWFRAIRIYDSGAPGETTGEVVAAVRKLRDRRPSRFAEILDEMEACTQSFMETLLTSDPSWSRLVDTMRRFEACLEELEVVPSSVAEVVRLIEGAGGAAKVSGAGSLSGSGAGSLIVLWPPEAGAEEQLEAILGSHGGSYRRIDAELGARGLELSR